MVPYVGLVEGLSKLVMVMKPYHLIFSDVQSLRVFHASRVMELAKRAS